MVSNKGGSDRVTRSANKPNPISDEDLMEIMKPSNPKDQVLSVYSAEAENEFEHSKIGKAQKVGVKTKSAKNKRKATSKTAKSVAKRSKPVKAMTKKGVADEVEILATSTVDVGTSLPGRKTSETDGGGRGILDTLLRVRQDLPIRKRTTSDESLHYEPGMEVGSQVAVGSVRNPASLNELYRTIARGLHDPTNENAAGSLVEKKIMERGLKEYDALDPHEKRKLLASMRLHKQLGERQDDLPRLSLPERVDGDVLDVHAKGEAAKVNIGMFDAIKPQDPNTEKLKRFVTKNYVNSQTVSSYLPELSGQVGEIRKELHQEVEHRRFRNREIHEMLGDNRTYVETLGAEVSSLRDLVNMISQNRSTHAVHGVGTRNLMPKIDILESLDM
eukprot:augustus_masked-scaffold_68-processed-gene-0.0-mRNA-1 protein AED:1.00 eAED:1.00 QI:0/0/0/0/1/1/4/0/387